MPGGGDVRPAAPARPRRPTGAVAATGMALDDVPVRAHS